MSALRRLTRNAPTRPRVADGLLAIAISGRATYGAAAEGHRNGELEKRERRLRSTRRHCAVSVHTTQAPYREHRLTLRLFCLVDGFDIARERTLSRAALPFITIDAHPHRRPSRRIRRQTSPVTMCPAARFAPLAVHRRSGGLKARRCSWDLCCHRCYRYCFPAL